MAIKVLVVDDSSFFRRRVSEIVNQDPSLTVIGTANNGVEAIKMAKELQPDVITMDVEMPVMDGITAVRQIMSTQPMPILMFSSLTHDGARATLDALEAGALDFLPKRFEDIATNKDDAVLLLQQRIKAISRRRVTRTMPAHSAVPAVARPVERPNVSSEPRNAQMPVKAPSREPAVRSSTVRASGKQYRLLLIGTSTGGPVALQQVLSCLPADYPHPILLIQHMPAAFTPAFASRLNGLCKIEVKEAENGDVLRPGCAYLAPGGMQMLLERGGTCGRLKVMPGPSELNYKPSVDITFASVAKLFGRDCLAVVLTGMGADGRDGSRLIKEAGGEIWAQDEASCVVYGMPQAVTSAGLSSHSLSLNDMGPAILKETYRG
ncbi:chemotaxis response regulator protein-glutamate methylesterase [Shewanella sp. NIFS-20-20]|uniref:protein-glutamate methylesterase/protein-glutamine glutaminase n=1 Tax=Shewanella sp. NIFS-20-20 TaxID=2853806 RepID=UPI001C4523B2|nr:chemotaxis response regulator protein-glutamate methylesterase [Shewanella sp. NIFS-20-20]MBV7314813.1 chemotaxis response regulator protein-glutamate methylesterase [Shewanella sp. NIFS-20-20]